MSDGLPPTVDPPFWLTRSWWYRAGHATLAIWIGTALVFAATVTVARALGPSRYGSVILAVSLAGLVFTLLDLTLEEAVVFHGSKLLVANDSVGLRGLLKAALLVDVLNASLVLGLMLSLAPGIAQVLSAGNADPSLLRIAALAAFATTLNGTTGALLLLGRRPDLHAWMTALAGLLRLIAVLIALGFSAGPRGVLIAFSAAAGIGALLQGLVAWRVTRGLWANGAREWAPYRKWLRPLVSFGIHTGLATSVLAGRGSIIPVILGRMAGVHAVGLFSVGMLPVSLASIATTGLRMSLFPEQAAMYSKGAWRNLRRSVWGHTLLGLAVGVPAATIGYFLLPWLISTLYSSDYSESVLPARILLITAIMYLAMGWTKTLPAAVGRPGVRTALGAFDLGVSALLIWLLASAEEVGAAIAIAISSVLLLLAWLFVLPPLLHSKQDPTRMPRAAEPETEP